MKAALYVRVSSEEQAQEGFSIAAQTNLLTERCNKDGIEVYRIYSDEGISGQKEDRPQFQHMIKDAEKRLFNIILVHKFDRFARKVELSQRIKAQLKKTGVTVISITEPIEDSPIGFFQEGILELLSEYYVRNLSAEIKKGHRERARQGYHSGSVPFGYKTDGKELVIYDQDAAIVREIFNMYAHQNMGQVQITRKLNAQHILSPSGILWQPSSIRRILSHEKYIGKIQLQGELYDGHHEPIIDEYTFYLVQSLAKERTHNRIRMGSSYENFLLAGLLRCGNCNWKMQVVRNQRHVYYACSSAYRADTPCKKEKHYPIDKLDKLILEKLKSKLQDIPNTSVNLRSDTALFKHNRQKRILEESERAKQAYLSGVFKLDEYAEIRKRHDIELAEIESVPDQQIIATTKLATLYEELSTCTDMNSTKSKLIKYIKNIYFYNGNIKFIFKT